MTDIYEKPSLDELAHFGVKGMKWGKRKAPSSSALAFKSAKSDRKELKDLSKVTYRGIRADRKAVRDRIDARRKSDPEYRDALKKIHQREQTAVNITVASSLGLLAATPVIAVYGDRVLAAGLTAATRAGLQGASSAYRGASRAANSEFVRGAARRTRNRVRYNPNSPLWDGVTVTSTAVKASMDLVRRYG